MPELPESPSTVLIDACPFINLYQMERLDVFARIDDMDFRMTDSVRAEIVREAEKIELEKLVEADEISEANLDDLPGLHFYAVLTQFKKGKGECSCLALAKREGWSVVTDDHKSRPKMRKVLGAHERVIASGELVSRADARP